MDETYALCNVCKDECQGLRKLIQIPSTVETALETVIQEYDVHGVYDKKQDMKKKMILHETTNNTNKYGTTALYEAVKRNFIEPTKVLLKANADPNKSKTGKYNLHSPFIRI